LDRAQLGFARRVQPAMGFSGAPVSLICEIALEKITGERLNLPPD
jgi:hypothetical protein